MIRHSVARQPSGRRKADSNLPSESDSNSSSMSTPDLKMKKRFQIFVDGSFLPSFNLSPKSEQTKSHLLKRLFINMAFTAITLYSVLSIQRLLRFGAKKSSSIRTNALGYLNKGFAKIENDTNRTGSFENCSSSTTNWIRSSTSAMLSQKDASVLDHQNYISGLVYVSCLPIRYRIPLDSLQRAAQAQTDIIVGILSNAGADGPMRRQVIRHTWASNVTFASTLTKDLILQQIEKTTLQAATAALDDPSPFLRTKAGVFFLVAGTWTDQLSKEFQLYRDLIWIDQAEVYDVEKSVLTYKTQSFASIVHREMKKFEVTGGYKYSYLFKTDDDSYVNLRYLHYELIERKRMTPIYPLSVPFMWGICTYNRRKPLRDLKYKWSISLESYPEEFYPTYCEGAGFALSRTLVDCMVDKDHIAQMRFMPFEDVSMGMLAERCHVELFVNAHELIHLYRTGYPYGSAQEFSRVDLNLGRLPDGDWLPEANMTGRIVQHRINSDVDMIEHHLKMLSSFYYDYYQDNTNKGI